MSITFKYPDNELALRISKGEIQAFDQLFLDMYPALYVLAFRMIGEEDTAKDILSETFLKLWEDRTSLTNVRNLRSYLYISVRNRTLDFLKMRKRSRLREDQAIEQDWLAATEEDFYRHLLGSEQARILYHAVSALPAECKKVVLLGLEGYTPSEIAKKLSISLSAVSNQKSRALKLLRKNIPSDILFSILL